MNHRSLFISSLLMLACFMHLTSAMAMSGPDAKRLSVTTFQLSDLVLRIPLPMNGLSKDMPYPRIPFVTKLDINQPTQHTVMLVDDLWDWRGPFWEGVHGSIAIKLSVDHVPRGVIVTCESSLRQMLQTQFDDEHREFVELGGQAQYARHYVIESQPRHLSGGAALVFGESGRYNTEFYIIPLSENVYLQIGFIFLSGGDQYRDWQSQAQKLKDAIIKGIRFEGNWPELHACPPR
jgi:hypothetical protein